MATCRGRFAAGEAAGFGAAPLQAAEAAGRPFANFPGPSAGAPSSLASNVWGPDWTESSRDAEGILGGVDMRPREQPMFPKANPASMANLEAIPAMVSPKPRGWASLFPHHDEGRIDLIMAISIRRADRIVFGTAVAGRPDASFELGSLVRFTPVSGPSRGSDHETIEFLEEQIIGVPRQHSP